MTSTVSYRPPGFHTAMPHLVVRDATRAIEFYAAAFGAKELPARILAPDGTIAHAEIRIGDSAISLSEEQGAELGPDSLGGSPVRVSLSVEDVDALARDALAAGATVVYPIEDQFYGYRSGRLRDPFGHLWIVQTRIEDLSQKEMQRRADDLYG